MKKKPRPTMEDVAKAAGVSRTTVSFVLNNVRDANIPETTRQRILNVARQMRYSPNSQALNLVKGKTMLIALIVRQTPEQLSVDAFIGELIRGITHVIEARGYHLLVHAVEPGSPNTTYGQLIRTRKVDGLVITAPLVNDPEIEMLHSEDIPVVINGSTALSDVAQVDVNNRQGARTATKYLVDLGHKRIGHISNAPFSYTSSHDRLSGYRLALADSSLPYDEDLVYEGAFTDVSGCGPMQAMLDLPDPPSAVFVGSDVVALGAIKVIYERGLKIPDDLSIIGFDDIFIGKYLQPPLTSVHLPAYELGKQASELILGVINGETLPSLSVQLPTELVIRNSTSAYKNR